MKLPIRVKFLIGVLGISLIVFLALLFIIERINYSFRVGQVKNMATLESASYTAEFNGFFKRIEKLPQGLAITMETLSINDPHKIVARLKQGVLGNPEIYGETIAFEPYALGPDLEYFAPYYYRKDGKLKFEQLGNESYDYPNKEWYSKPKKLGSPVWIDPYFDRGGGNIVMCTYSVPFYRDGKFMGVITVDISVSDLMKKVSGINKQTGGYTIIMTSSGRFVVHPDPRMILTGTVSDYAKKINDPGFASLVKKVHKGDTGFEKTTDYLDGHPAWLYFSTINSTGWIMAIIYPQKEMLEPVYHSSGVIVLVGIISLLLLALIVIYVARTITSPLTELAKVAHDIASGEIEERVIIKDTGDEVSVLARSFNNMVDTLLSCKLDLDNTIVVKDRMELELRSASEIQKSILPTKMPDIPGFSIYAKSIPARESGGDFYDFEYRHDGGHGIFIGDTSGKGLPAALYMLQARTTTRSLTQSLPNNLPSAILKELNHLLLDLLGMTGLFTTMIYGILNPEFRELTFASGGHTEPLFFKKSEQKAEFIESGGSILGLLKEDEMSEIKDFKITMEPGDVLMLYSDGLTDEFSSSREMFGDERLLSVFEKSVGLSPDIMAHAIIEEIHTFCNGNYYDDLTLVVIKAL